MTSALLVIDMQRGLLEPDPRPFEADLVVDRINAMAARARAAGAWVFFVQHEGASDNLVRGTPGWELAPRLFVLAGDRILRKTTPDSFLRTGLAEVLEGGGVGTVAVCGYASEYCVDTTARRAAALGFAVVVAADAHTTHDAPHLSAARIREHHNATLAAITSFGPAIVSIPSAEVVFARPARP